MDDGQHHQTGLRDAKTLEKERWRMTWRRESQNVKHQDHRVDKVKVGLKDFVLEFLPEKRS